VSATIPDLFKSFQDKIKLHSLEDVMYLTWGLMRNLQFDKPVPSDIETSVQYDQSADIFLRRTKGINEWELEFILMEAIISSPANIHTAQTLKRLGNSAGLVNSLRRLENEIALLFLKDDSKTVFKEFFRMSHRQFTWQTAFTTESTYRYYRIFNFEGLKEIVQRVVGLTPFELYQIGIAVTALFNNNFSATIPIKSFIKTINEEKLGLFIYTFGIDLTTLRQQSVEARKLDETLVYSYNPLRAHPIILKGAKAYCPMPTMVLWQITSGIYYKLVNEEGFNDAFGASFQDYVGFIIEQALTNKAEFTVYSEKKYGKPEKRTIDWVIEDSQAYLMIECKGKRITQLAKSELMDGASIQSDLEKMAGFITQSYKTVADCRNGLYPHVEYKSEKQAYILILTLEEWFVNFNPEFLDELRAKVIASLEKLGLAAAMVEQVPYFIDSIGAFERNLQLIHQIGIKKYFEALTANELAKEMEKFPARDLLTPFFVEEIDNKIIGI
jgi:hypothetical protein